MHVRAAFQRLGVVDVQRDSGPELRSALGVHTIHQETVKETVDWLTRRDELIKKRVPLESSQGRQYGVRYIVNGNKFVRV